VFNRLVSWPIFSDPDAVLEALNGPGLEVLYSRHYHEYDVYFIFEDPDQGILRYREDEYIDENDQISNVRNRLTMIGPTREAQYDSDVLLSRSRYIAPATHSPRFYREYFNPSKEVVIEKHRLRWRVRSMREHRCRERNGSVGYDCGLGITRE